MKTEIDKHDLCANCGHYLFLHLNFLNECEACDSPEVSIDKKCPGFLSAK